MIYDSDAQRNFLLDCVRKYPTNYETALNCATAFGQSIQEGRVIPVKEQLEKFPLPKPQATGEENAKDATNEATKEVKINSEDLKKVAGNGSDAKEQPEHDLTKGPAPEGTK